jgi:RNA polymerase sigma-70 factor (ECF subfamily)
MNRDDSSSTERRAHEGDREAFQMLMARHKQALFRFARHYTKDNDDAYDIVQESFTAAWLAIGRYDAARPFDIWVRRIALNKCRDLARRRKVYAFVLGNFGTIRDLLATEAEAVERDAAENGMQQMHAAIDALPAGLRDPLILTALEGLSHKAAGEVLGLNAKAVEVRVYRAKKKLAAMLSPFSVELPSSQN